MRTHVVATRGGNPLPHSFIQLDSDASVTICEHDDKPETFLAYVCGECTRAPCPPPACTSAQTPYPTHTTHPRALPLLSDTNKARATCT